MHSELSNINSTAADVILFLALTGWRNREANNLRWTEIDIDRKMAILADTKTGQSIRPLSNAAIEVLLRRRNVKDSSAQFVFATNLGRPLHNINENFSKLGLPKDVTPHTLRHSFASLAADLGLPDHTISGLLGHARQGITSRYMHLGDNALLDAADLVANETLRLMRRAFEQAGDREQLWWRNASAWPDRRISLRIEETLHFGHCRTAAGALAGFRVPTEIIGCQMAEAKTIVHSGPNGPKPSTIREMSDHCKVEEMTMAVCSVCNGTGRDRGKVCRKCNGTGKVEEVCSVCNGTGRDRGKVCKKCNGTGKV